MAIKVTGECVIPAHGEGFCTEWYERYTHGRGLRRARHITTTSESDFNNSHTVRYSDDNGRTWSPESDVRGGECFAAPDGSWEWVNIDLYTDIHNPVHGHSVGVRMERIYRGGHAAAEEAYWAGRAEMSDHCYLLVREGDGPAAAFPIRYEDGPAFDPADPLDEAYFNTNTSFFGMPHVAGNGDLWFALCVGVTKCCRMLGMDVREVFPSCPDIVSGMLVCHGVWDGTRYDLTFSRPVVISDLLSSRGLMEPTVAVLKSGRVLVVLRGSNERSENWHTRIVPGAPGLKWYCWSDDGGKTFTAPMPWHFDDGQVLCSGSAISHLIRSGKTGTLYWIGNVTSHRVDGSFPRWPLQIVEVDETCGTAKKETLTVIDTKREGETDKVQLSNFSLLEDRETGNLELLLTKFGQHSDTYRAETWKYTIEVT